MGSISQNNSNELSEKNFIHEPKRKNRFPFWLWFFLFTVVVSLFWGGINIYSEKLHSIVEVSPFLQVTNRQLSLFLWQNPEFMRVNSKDKNAYLPAFNYLDKVTIAIGQADQYAVAPPELLFRYHTWKRLISDEFTERPISQKEFSLFLSYAEEWQPRYWADAPQGYVTLTERLDKTSDENLSDLPSNILPLEVRIAFQGWKNYFQEGEAINSFQPTYKQLRDFLAKHPDYARNYWRNIVEEYRPNYLKSLSSGLFHADALVPENETSGFLKMAVYNYMMSLNQNR